MNPVEVCVVAVPRFERFATVRTVKLHHAVGLQVLLEVALQRAHVPAHRAREAPVRILQRQLRTLNQQYFNCLCLVLTWVLRELVVLNVLRQ